MELVIDLFVIGGGINGVAIAADAASRGLNVVLCEQNDLASGTSFASTKLIHGGLRYLELYEFRLVKKALVERDILLKRAAHLIKPQEFILPYEKHLRPLWLLYLGLFFYHFLARKSLLSKFAYIKKLTDKILKPLFKKAFRYLDAYTDDARLVIANALSAKNFGATILTYTILQKATRTQKGWQITLLNKQSQQRITYFAKVLVNAGGPWVNLIQQVINPKKTFVIDLVKGSHIVVKKLYDEQHAYILQCQDKRIIFVIPFHNHFTLIGTTDTPFKNESLENINIEEKEAQYLLHIVNNYFTKSINKEDIVWSYSGVRALQHENVNNLSKITRDYYLDVEIKDHFPLVTIIGGKLTTHRVLAEEAVDKLIPFFSHIKKSNTANFPLPGGDIANVPIFLNKVKNEFSFIPDTLLKRYVDSYGTDIYKLLENKKTIKDFGIHFGAGLYEHEVVYLIQHEWAKTVDDIIWRRTKLGLSLQEEEKISLGCFLAKISL